MAKRDLKRDPGVWVAVLVVAVLVAGALVRGTSFGGGGGDGEQPTSAGAQTACEDRVKTLLKSPTSAKFSRVAAVPQGGNTWKVSGAVDSQNSFGAQLRGSFTCLASSDDGELWTTSRASVS